ncbi:hypothetical protein Tco_1227131 [Tanacetum coccineum]
MLSIYHSSLRWGLRHGGNALYYFLIQECKIQEVNVSNAYSGDTDSSGIVSDKGNAQGLENQSNTSGDESSRSRNDCNDKSTFGDDTDIRPSLTP